MSRIARPAGHVHTDVHIDRDSLRDRDPLEAVLMPLSLCRGPNDDCSAVQATNKSEAVEILAEVDSAEDYPLTPPSDFIVHFHLSDHGRLSSRSLVSPRTTPCLGGCARYWIMLLLNTQCNEAGSPIPEEVAAIGGSSSQTVGTDPRGVRVQICTPSKGFRKAAATRVYDPRSRSKWQRTAPELGSAPPR
jgi:hypothetical protein